MDMGEAVRQIKDRLSLAELAGHYIELRRNGGRYVAPCPFHQETKPSFSINDEKGFFYCFGCQASGDIIEFYGRINGLDFRDSVCQLADMLQITIDAEASPAAINARRKETSEKRAMLSMHQDAANRFVGNLARDAGGECLEYIESRGLSREIVEYYELGWASRDWHDLDHFLSGRGHDPLLAVKCGLLGKSGGGGVYDRFRGRLMFPIKSLSNQIIAFGGRIIANEDEAKYINSADTPIYSKKEHLYGLAQARRGIVARGSALLTEGYMDVLAMRQFGYDNCVGVLGTALTEEQIRRLSGFTSRIELLFDGDRAGRKAALRAAELFLSRGIGCSVIMLPEGEDIDSLLRNAGPQAFDKLRANAPDGLAFCLRTLADLAPREALDWAKNFLSRVELPELTSKYASELAQRLGISESGLREGLRPGKSGQKKGVVSAELCARDTQIILFAVRYPERLEDLRHLGADLALAHKRSREFWDVIEKYGPDEVEYHLDDRQKKFWIEKRGPLAPPRDNGDVELACLRDDLDRFYAKSQASALQAALADRGAGRDFDDDLEFLSAIRDVMRKNDEQS